MVPLSVLDLSPICEGSDAAQALPIAEYVIAHAFALIVPIDCRCCPTPEPA
jgi:hypothetical protein